MPGVKQPQSIDSSVLARIRARGRGWVFTPADFADLGSATAVHLALMRNSRAGVIRRLARGIYDFPRSHPKLGVLAPSLDGVAKALQAKDASRVLPTGAYAANLLGLSEQVPVRAIFLTDGPARRVKIGKQEIVLQQRGSRTMATAGRPSGLVIQALEYLGQDHVDDGVVAKLRERFNTSQLIALGKDAKYATGWIAEIMRSLASGAQKDVSIYG
jgi:hypothetical protein